MNLQEELSEAGDHYANCLFFLKDHASARRKNPEFVNSSPGIAALVASVLILLFF
jgi:hypothetical protein